MEKQRYIIKFEDVSEDVSEEIASRYASELRDALLDAVADIEVEQRRADSRAQDTGSILVLILGTPAVLAVVKAIGDWLKMRYSASIDIETIDGKIHVKNITGQQTLRLAEIFHQRSEEGSYDYRNNTTNCPGDSSGS